MLGFQVARPGNQVLFRNEPDELVVGIAAAFESRRCAARRRDFQEVSTLHVVPVGR